MPEILRESNSITFAVDDVAPAEAPAETCKTHEAIKRLVGGPIESCCDYSDDCVADVHWNPLIHAVYFAFSEHRPLVLSPDMIWIAIAQGVAIHINQNAERLRSRFVAHEGKAEIVVTRDDFIKGSPENPWPEVFEAFSSQVAEHVGEDVHRFFVADFSTTGPVERAASEVVMLDAFQQYFDYVMLFICGIPTVTLEGTADDWRRIADRVEQLEYYDLGWWREFLRLICREFVAAAEGEPNIQYWQRICKLREAYGGATMNGWITHLFPYLEVKNSDRKPRNPLLTTGSERNAGLPPSSFPIGLSEAPFTFADLEKGRTYAMRMMGGFVGVTQSTETRALRPKIGWVVREAARLDQIIEDLKQRDDVLTSPRSTEEPDEETAGRRQRAECPADMAQLSAEFETIGFYLGNGRPVYEFTPLGSKYVHIHDDRDEYGRVVASFFRGSDGSSIGFSNGGRGWVYYVIDSERPRMPLAASVIGFSAAEVIEQILAANGRLLHEWPDFQPIDTVDPTDYGDCRRVIEKHRPSGESN